MIKNPDTSGYEYKYLTLDVKGAWCGVPLLFLANTLFPGHSTIYLRNTAAAELEKKKGFRFLGVDWSEKK